MDAQVPANERGFTLAELLISVSMTVFVVATAYMLLNTVTIDSNMVQARTQAAEENARAIHMITGEIRQAAEITEGYGVFDPAIFSATACGFYSDVDRDGAPEKVTYYVLGGALMKSVYQNTTAFAPYEFAELPADGYPQVVCSSVSNTDVFRYVDRQDPPEEVSADNSQAVSVVIVHIVDVVTVGGHTGRSDIETWVEIRTAGGLLE